MMNPNPGCIITQSAFEAVEVAGRDVSQRAKNLRRLASGALANCFYERPSSSQPGRITLRIAEDFVTYCMDGQQ